MSYRIVYTKTAAADIPKLKAAHLAKKAQVLIGILAEHPFQNPPPYEKLRGNLQGAYARRLNIQHRLSMRCWRKKRRSRLLVCGRITSFRTK